MIPVIKIALSFFITSLALFMAAEAISFLPISYLAKAFYQLGALSLLASFGLLFAILLLLAGKQTLRVMCLYFSGIERQQRRNWFTLGKLERERRLFSQRTLKTRYFLDLKRKQLVGANDRKHSRSLARAIDRDLTMIRPHVPPEQFKVWRRQNNQYRKQANIEGLIALQQTIINHL